MMMLDASKSFWFALLVIVLLAAGCSQPEVEVAGGPTPGGVAEAATATSISASATAPPAATEAAAILPEATLPPPVVVATVVPATATVVPSPTALVLLNAEDFGENRNPLTGEVVEDPAVLQRLPLAVKIPNDASSYVRPQYGLSQADLVFEHVAEGLITRFTAIFYSQTPEEVGPIRSARLIDLELPAMYDTALLYSGASIGVSNRLQDVDFRERVFREGRLSGYYRTGANKPTEHTLHGRPAQWWEGLEAQGMNRAPSFGEQMAFSEQPPAGGEPVTHIEVRSGHLDTMKVDWRYDEETGRYERWANEVAHVDQNTGEQISSANVVAVYAHHPINYSICENLQNNQCLAFSTEIQIWGEGQAVLFRDGQMYNATWKRAQRNDMLTFYDEAGNELPLKIGNTWFQMVPTGSDYLTVE